MVVDIFTDQSYQTAKYSNFDNGYMFKKYLAACTESMYMY